MEYNFFRYLKQNKTSPLRQKNNIATTTLPLEGLQNTNEYDFIQLLQTKNELIFKQRKTINDLKLEMKTLRHLIEQKENKIKHVSELVKFLQRI